MVKVDVRRRLVSLVLVCFGFAGLAPVNGDAAASATPSGPWEIGFFESDVSTHQPLAMAGYGTYVYPNTPRLSSTGVHDPLKASAIALSSGAQELIVVGVDAVGISGVALDRIRAKVQSRVGGNVEILVASSHTHHAPDLLGLWGPLPFTGRDKTYTAFFEGKVAEAAIRAHLAREPMTLRVAHGRHANDTTYETDEINRDDGFFVFAAYDLLGKLRGTFTQWSAHPTVIDSNNHALSADYVGAFRRVMEQRLGGVHVYVNGAIGAVYHDANAKYPGGLIDDLFPEGDHDSDAQAEYRLASTVGWSLAEDVLRALPSAPMVSADTFSHCKVEFQVTINNLKFQSAVRLGVVESKFSRGKVTTDAHAFRLGDVQMVSLPAEVFPNVANNLRSLVGENAERMGVIGVADDWLGYVLTEADFDSEALKYWRGLSPSRLARHEFQNAAVRAIRNEGCK